MENKNQKWTDQVRKTASNEKDNSGLANVGLGALTLGGLGAAGYYNNRLKNEDENLEKQKEVVKNNQKAVNKYKKRIKQITNKKQSLLSSLTKSFTLDPQLTLNASIDSHIIPQQLNEGKQRLMSIAQEYKQIKKQLEQKKQLINSLGKESCII